MVATGVVFIGSDDGALYALDAPTGKELWRFQTGSDVASSAAVTGGLVYIGSFDGILMPLTPPRATSNGASKPAARFSLRRRLWMGLPISAATTVRSMPSTPPPVTKRRRFQTSQRLASSPAVAAGAVYVGSLDGVLYVLDVATGTERWTLKRVTVSIARQPSPEGSSTSAALTASSMPLTPPRATSNGASKPAARFSLRRRLWMGLPMWGMQDGILYALDAATGEERWRFATDVVFTSSPAVSQETVVAASGQSLYALDAGRMERWRFEMSDVLASSPAIADGLVYVGSWDGAVYAIGSSDRNQSSDSLSPNYTSHAKSTIAMANW